MGMQQKGNIMNKELLVILKASQSKKVTWFTTKGYSVNQ